VPHAAVAAIGAAFGPAHHFDASEVFSGGEVENVLEWEGIKDGGDETELHGRVQSSGFRVQ
jgi:hypothetical protein